MGKPRGRPSPDLWEMTVCQFVQLAAALDMPASELCKKLTPAWERFDEAREARKAKR
jgi:hypothetical protein